ncbi:hypothetical protein PUNSTDRAFT_44856 [Punctularia strigosozonata HHB-11173 SS5]|uniref:uncharacterized protein n=1 Tax=Punctularia strigosozonata (strain HHB-11173) TaxID=741275 RepID=UPI0004416661|nr:uncharacterized protein PUNSTDRAFT_44856 [Punctularia strigosozonata HHB-11173 SS5]EIN08326.1 hypothetical protein PUNSTDRAFT_44856 [Punctularia strigosozonata HHB-11173 SS5]
MLIATLRDQVQDLFTQVSQLNGKLVQSYGRVADLEDDIHAHSSQLRASSLKIAQLELERSQHLSALNEGVLVERSHVTTELSRLMERATEEAARRGQAESARAEIEKDLDDLSANLFGQANTMVAQARVAQAISERKVAEAEQALRGAEDAVALMQQQMQALQEEKEMALREAEQMRSRMGKGKWIEKEPQTPTMGPLRMLRLHAPYQEFILFVSHLRSLRSSSTTLPALSTLLPLPLLARLQTEDTDPTVRLDLAPSLNWLSRRSVLSAIHNGELNIEPMTATHLLHELSSTNISCALCGTAIFPSDAADSKHPRPPAHPRSRTTSSSGAWVSSASSLFKNTLGSSTPVSAASPLPSPPLEPKAQKPAPTQIYIFRLSPSHSTSSLPMPLPLGSSPSRQGHPTTPLSPTSAKPAQIYPLCTNGWCLRRLRATCSLWAFVRIALVEKIWEEAELAAAHSTTAANGVIHSPVPKRPGAAPLPVATEEKPPIPPRRRSKMGGLWSALGSLANSSSSSSLATAAPEPPKERSLPPPPPPRAHPITPPRSVKTTPTQPTQPIGPPPIPRRNASRGASSDGGSSPEVPTRPPLPQRNSSRPDVPSRGRALSVVESVEEKSIYSKDEKAPPLPQPVDANHDEKTEQVKVPDADVPASEDAKKEDPVRAPTPSESQSDGFHTPLDELSSAPLSRQVSQRTDRSEAETSGTSEPTLVPLPESASQTPVQAAFPPNVQDNPTPATHAPPPLPPRHMSPARAASPSHQEAPVRPPSRSGSGSPAPPPIPRRAAARAARPLSAIATAPPITAEDVKEPVAEKEHREPTKTTEAEPGPGPTVDAAAPASDALAEDGPKADSIPAPEVADAPKSDHAVAAAPEEKKVEAPSTAAVNGSPDVPKAAEEASLSSSLTETSAPMQESTPPAPLKHAPEETPKAEDDDGQYVGDATWEERAWKELARLREDMFWARVGGLR